MKGPNDSIEEKKDEQSCEIQTTFLVCYLCTYKKPLEPLAFSPFLMGYTLQNAFDGIFSATFAALFSSILPIHSKKNSKIVSIPAWIFQTPKSMLLLAKPGDKWTNCLMLDKFLLLIWVANTVTFTSRHAMNTWTLFTFQLNLIQRH